MTYRLLTPALLASLALLSACNEKGATPASAAGNQTAVKAGPVATVNGQSISNGLFDFYARNRTGKPAGELNAEQKQELLDQLIGLQVAAQTAVKNGLDREADTVARLELLRLNALAEAQVAQKFSDDRATEQELRAEYESQVAVMPGLEYHARHILVATEPFAQSLIDKIKGGAKFEELARKESMDLSNKEKGGDLGWFNVARMVPEFSTAVEGLKKGEMTQTPIKTEFGYHIIRLEDTRPTSAPEFDQVKERLAPVVRQKKVQAYVDELKKDMRIEKTI